MRFSPSLLVSSALMGILLAHGCATVSSSVMVPQTFKIERALGGSVQVNAEGSPKRAFVLRPIVRDEALREAVVEAVKGAELFDSVVTEGADRRLMVSVQTIEAPEIGLDQSCTVSIRWKLISGDGEQTLWEEVITTERTVNSFEELDWEERGQRAIEGALQLNVQRGLERLSRAG